MHGKKVTYQLKSVVSKCMNRKKQLQNANIILFLKMHVQNQRRFFSLHACIGSQDSKVSIVTGYMMDSLGVGVKVPVELIFVLSTLSRLILGPIQPYMQWVPG
jgi:hypothetical protein